MNDTQKRLKMLAERARARETAEAAKPKPKPKDPELQEMRKLFGKLFSR